MLEETPNHQIFWKKTSSHGARILRIFSRFPIIEIPIHVSGYPVTELGNYCFAPDCRLPDDYLATDIDSQHIVLTEFSGNYPQTIYLPDTLQKIGDYAFYNCRFLSVLRIPDKLRTIGSDAFMNCHNLHQLIMTCSPDKNTGLRQILAQISWDVEISFSGLDSAQAADKAAAVFYPEFYEIYDEIAPAHIFGQKIIGEGFRARQCFTEGTIDFPLYDQIFPKACVDESEQTLCHMAFCRIRYPYSLTSSMKKQYAHYILAHGRLLCKQLIKERRLHDLAFLFQEHLLSGQNIQYAISLAAQTGWSEGNASMLRWNQTLNQTRKNKRYEFDDFCNNSDSSVS